MVNPWQEEETRTERHRSHLSSSSSESFLLLLWNWPPWELFLKLKSLLFTPNRQTDHLLNKSGLFTVRPMCSASGRTGGGFLRVTMQVLGHCGCLCSLWNTQVCGMTCGNVAGVSHKSQILTLFPGTTLPLHNLLSLILNPLLSITCTECQTCCWLWNRINRWLLDLLTAAC